MSNSASACRSDCIVEVDVDINKIFLVIPVLAGQNVDEENRVAVELNSALSLTVD